MVKPTIKAFLQKYFQMSRVSDSNYTLYNLFMGLNSPANFPSTTDTVDCLKSKKEWELNCIQWIYRKFKDRVQQLVKYIFDTQ